MTQREELLRFIGAASQNGIPDQAISSLLESNGWSAKEVFAAMRDHYEAIAGVPVPVRRGFSEGAREAFLHLIAFGTLSVWTVALGAILFHLIEGLLPDPVMARNYDGRPLLAGHIASLIVAFPIYVLATRQSFREMAANPERRDSAIRRWLTWLALLVAASVVIADVITVLTSLLRGEFTLRFLLRALIVLLLAGGVFWFYLSALRDTLTPVRVFAIAATLAVLGGLISGFMMLGPPSVQRQFEADRRRVEHLRELSGLLQGRTELPDTLDELPFRRADPITRQPYDYRRLSSTRYELCAIFQSAEDRIRFWSHSSGRHCFTLDTARAAPD